MVDLTSLIASFPTTLLQGETLTITLTSNVIVYRE